ncbi:hypothetical protein CRG98_044753 [Punica granatum]|uniref:Uncharacterized protein n=1 Tax=Punica granatum TaxID=22663 RepID=A0A2I0HT04_PUNGR|nr:hypothetical protein CRG98_044753 [Punica granatum]
MTSFTYRRMYGHSRHAGGRGTPIPMKISSYCRHSSHNVDWKRRKVLNVNAVLNAGLPAECGGGFKEQAMASEPGKEDGVSALLAERKKTKGFCSAVLSLLSLSTFSLFDLPAKWRGREGS